MFEDCQNKTPGKREIIIGVVGGMGPAAGIFLCNQLVCLTDTDEDQGHFSFVLMSLPCRITDRTAFLCGKTTKNPAFAILEIIERLQQSGASIIGIPCNTSHSPKIFDVIENGLTIRNLNVRLLHMPQETCLELHRIHPSPVRVGLMVTNGTFQSGVYEKLLESMGYDVVLPDFAFQTNVIHRVVYDPVFGIKANSGKFLPEAKILFTKAVDFYEQQGVDTIILGCTEFSLIEMPPVRRCRLVDSSVSLAKALIREALSAGHTGTYDANNFKQ